MNVLLSQIVDAVKGALVDHLPDVASDQLEGAGAVYYMNGKNGTEFDWFVNEHLPSFMAFYDDEQNLGAAKANVYVDGHMEIYLYGDKGKVLVKQVESDLAVEGDELLHLAVCLRCGADDKRLWGADVEKIATDTLPSPASVSEFLDHRHFYEPSIVRRQMLGKLAVVSRRITEDHYKVGYMSRGPQHDDEDSGWELYAGNEEEGFVEDVSNFALCYVSEVVQIDDAVLKYLDSEEGTALVRVSADEFAKDDGQTPRLERW
ncbi:MAG: DUF2185 domain-containing protein [Atopobiaceae bacterium]|nr:DUF2185 domain-containing protein [Atopobiaceae bacterium]